MNFDLENEKIEFKREYTDTIKKEVIAFANTSSGIVYVGVDNKGNLYPIPDIVMQRGDTLWRQFHKLPQKLMCQALWYHAS